MAGSSFGGSASNNTSRLVGLERVRTANTPQKATGTNRRPGIPKRCLDVPIVPATTRRNTLSGYFSYQALQAASLLEPPIDSTFSTFLSNKTNQIFSREEGILNERHCELKNTLNRRQLEGAIWRQACLKVRDRRPTCACALNCC